MKSGWKEMAVGEILQLEYGKPLEEFDRKRNGRFPVYGANGEKDRTDRFYYEKPSIIVGRKGSAGEINLTEKKFWPLDVTYFVTFDEKQYDLGFLYYLLTNLDLPKLAKGVKPGINRNEVYSQLTKVPTLPEQQRIVGILDKAFEGIATAKANAEKNRQNARALFESHLQSVFTQRGKGWSWKPLGSLCELISGQHIDAKDYNVEHRGVGYLTGPSDFGFTNPAVAKWTEHPKRMAKRGDILITVKGSGVGKINLLDVKEVAISRQLMAVRATATDASYLYALLSTKFGYFQSLSKGAAIPGISREDVLELMCPMPPPGEQQAIVKLINSAADETQRLGALCERKIGALEALKKSLLHQAFTGNL